MAVFVRLKSIPNGPVGAVAPVEKDRFTCVRLFGPDNMLIRVPFERVATALPFAVMLAPTFESAVKRLAVEPAASKLRV